MKRAYFRNKHCAIRFYHATNRVNNTARLAVGRGYYTVYWRN